MFDLAKLKEEQLRLARRIIKKDDFPEINNIAGCDIAYTGKNVICSIVVMDFETLKIRESKYKIGNVNFPYIPGFLSYREAPLVIDTYHELELDPDVILIDGNGILHPRKMGLACHVGLSLDKPAIGVAKKLLCGDPKEDSIILNDKIVGKAIKTKEISNPIYISTGHKVSLNTAVDIVKKTLREHKLPEPLHEAHKQANKVRRKIKSGELEKLPYI